MDFLPITFVTGRPPQIYSLAKNERERCVPFHPHDLQSGAKRRECEKVSENSGAIDKVARIFAYQRHACCAAAL
jgi:hypothetical protein